LGASPAALAALLAVVAVSPADAAADPGVAADAGVVGFAAVASPAGAPVTEFSAAVFRAAGPVRSVIRPVRLNRPTVRHTSVRAILFTSLHAHTPTAVPFTGVNNRHAQAPVLVRVLRNSP
jgi:hypothetical protein